MVKFKQHNPKSFSLDLVPMINVVFLLLIFFMLTSTGIQQYKDIELPEAQSSEEIATRNIIVAVLPNGTISLDGVPIEIDSLLITLKKKLQKTKGQVVEVQADKNIPFEVFGELIETAQNAGAIDFVLTTEADK